MKTLKKPLSLLMALFMCLGMFAGTGVTAFAAGETMTTYMVDIPRANDPNKAGWGHPALNFLGGWSTSAGTHFSVHTQDAYNGRAIYCIEPGIGVHSGDQYTGRGEDFWDNYPSSLNPTIPPNTIKEYIGRIMTYGWQGNASMTPEERLYAYSQSSQIEGQTGCIGYLRGDFGAGQEFYTSWFDRRKEYKDGEFKAEFDEVVNALREKDGLLCSRASMNRFCCQHPEAEFEGNYCTEYGFKVQTSQHTYMLRCNLNYGDYNFYLYAYVARFLEHHIEKAQEGIRFMASSGRELFRIPDGDHIRIQRSDGSHVDRSCRYIDECHMEIGGGCGIAQTEAQKSSDLFMKCRYLDELTGGRGTIFATGTPISNSMVELYTIQRYLQYGLLQEMGLIHFDDWASDFGETITAIELSPEGTGYRAKTRFAKFFNLPELMAAFKQVADIQTADMLHLPVPKANFHTEVIKPSELQQEMVKGLAERAEKIRDGGVDPHVDNMLRITNDGRKLALDMRLINPLAADDPNGKVAVCARNVYKIWEQTKEQRSTQLVFCDLSTPTKDGSFNVYDDLKKKLMEQGIAGRCRYTAFFRK